MTPPRLVRVATALLAATVLFGCTVASHPVSSPRPVSAPTTAPTVTSTHPSVDCPPLKKASGFVTIDYVDFVRYDGRDYISGLDDASRHPVSASLLGRELFRVRCSLAALNDRTGKQPAERRDGDAAFVPAGTPVYTVRGWSPRCRLAARHDGRLYLYLAYRNGGQRATPVDCALPN